MPGLEAGNRLALEPSHYLERRGRVANPQGRRVRQTADHQSPQKQPQNPHHHTIFHLLVLIPLPLSITSKPPAATTDMLLHNQSKGFLPS